jgi:uncharacterized membrane protein
MPVGGKTSRQRMLSQERRCKMKKDQYAKIYEEWTKEEELKDRVWKLISPLIRFTFRASDFIIIFLLLIPLWLGGCLIAKALGEDWDE